MLLLKNFPAWSFAFLIGCLVAGVPMLIALLWGEMPTSESLAMWRPTLVGSMLLGGAGGVAVWFCHKNA